jgi:putative heme-binding domain-containing protein
VEAEAWDRLAISMRALLSRRLDPPALHAAILVSHQQHLVSYQDLKEIRDPVAIRQGLLCFTPDDSASANLSLGIAKRSLDADDPELAEVALRFVVSHPDADEWIAPDLMAWLSAPVIADARLQALRGFCLELSSGGETAKLLAAMLRHESPAVEKVALDVIAARGTDLKAEDWLEAIDASWGESPSPSVLDAIKALGSDHFNERLMALAADRSRPLAIRLKALAAAQGVELKGEVFEFVRGVLSDGGSSPAAKIQAAEMLAAGPVKAETLRTIAPLFGSVGPVELKILIGMLRRVRDVDAARSVALALAQSPVLASRQESHYRQAFSGVPPEIFEDIVRPAYAKATEMLEAKRRGLSGLAAKAAVSGDMDAGSDHFAAGKGTCIACHRVGELGRAIGPDLTKIGAIRTERDLLESILFPSNTLARDYETHVIETDEGRQILGLIESHTAEGLLIVDAAGQKVSVSHEHIAGNTTLEMSLMPMGLDQTMSEQELLDLVAYLRSLK